MFGGLGKGGGAAGLKGAEWGISGLEVKIKIGLVDCNFISAGVRVRIRVTHACRQTNQSAITECQFLMSETV